MIQIQQIDVVDRVVAIVGGWFKAKTPSHLLLRDMAEEVSRQTGCSSSKQWHHLLRAKRRWMGTRVHARACA